MKIVIVNANQNQSVNKTISFLKTRLGDDNVDVIEYGSQQDSNNLFADIKHTNQLQRLLERQSPVRYKEYDVLLIAGGHGNREPKSFNGLNVDGVRHLIDHFKDNNITFNHILLGACFSAQFQLRFLPLLSGESGTILAFTSIATSNFCSLAEDIARGEKPDIAPIITNGFEQHMNEFVLTADEDVNDQLTNKLIEDFKPIKESIEVIGLVSQEQDSNEEAITFLKSLQQEKNNAILTMMKNHHDDIMASQDPLLVSAVETTLSLYHGDTVYLRSKTPFCLPKDVLLASDNQEEIKKQLVIINDIVRELGYFDGTVTELTAPELLDHYKKIFSATMQFDTPDSDEPKNSASFGYS